MLNNFFDRFIYSTNGSYEDDKGIYVRIKWLVWIHGVITEFDSSSIMFGFIAKGIQVYIDKCCNVLNDAKGYEKYLLNSFLKPYLQYLVKLCQLL